MFVVFWLVLVLLFFSFFEKCTVTGQSYKGPNSMLVQHGAFPSRTPCREELKIGYSHRAASEGKLRRGHRSRIEEALNLIREEQREESKGGRGMVNNKDKGDEQKEEKKDRKRTAKLKDEKGRRARWRGALRGHQPWPLGNTGNHRAQQEPGSVVSRRSSLPRRLPPSERKRIRSAAEIAAG
jgi:hypothetical protein